MGRVMMRLRGLRFFFFIFTAFALLSINSVANAAFRAALENGLTVIIEEDHSAPVAAIQLWVKVGSADETENESGIAHVFEHMLFKGTGKRQLGEIAGTIEALGGDINAYTSYDNTVYHVTMPSRHFLTGLDIISDAAQNSAFDPQELKKELQVVLEEIRMNEDKPERNLYKTIFNNAYAKHPYKKPVIGFQKTVEGFKREDILKFFKTWYVPNNMTLVIAGDVRPDEVMAEARRLFKDFRKSPLPKRIRPLEPAQNEPRGEVVFREIKQTQLGLAFHIPELKHDDTYALDVLAGILGGSDSSRLYKRLKIEDASVHDIGAYAMSLKDPGLFFITAVLDAHNAAKAVDAILDEIRRIAEEVPSSEELQRIKINLESDFVYSRETMDGIASKLGYYETYAGDIDYEKKYIEGIRAVSADIVRESAQRYLRGNRASFGVVAPAGEHVAGADILAALNKKTEPTKGTDARKKEVTRITLENGITLIIKEVHSNPTVAVYSTFPGGLRFETAEKNGISNLTARMLERGTKKRSRDEITKEVEDIAGSVGGFSGWNSTGVSAKFLSRFFEKGLQIYADVLLNPSFPEDEIERLKTDVLTEIKRQEDYLPGYTFKLLYKELFKNHPYGMPVSGTADTVAGLKREDILRHYEEFFTPQRMVISIVGDVNTERTIRLIKEQFKDFAKTPVALPLPKPQEPVPGVLKTGEHRDKAQVNIGIGFHGTNIGNTDSYALKVATEVLAGQGGRLFMNLRDRESLAYAISAFSREGADPGIFAAYIATAPEKKEAAIGGILTELKLISTEGITEDELRRAKGSIIGGFEIGLQEVSSQAASLANNELYGLGLEYNALFPKKIEAVTIADVLRVAGKYITLDAYAISEVGPKPKEEKGIVPGAEKE